VKNIKRNVQQGFTLIELMIVIAIVAILVALAVPAYQDYTIRAKVAECVNAAAVPKLSISEYYETTGSFPVDITEAGMAAQGNSQYCETYTTYTTTGTGVTAKATFVQVLVKKQHSTLKLTKVLQESAAPVAAVLLSQE